MKIRHAAAALAVAVGFCLPAGAETTINSKSTGTSFVKNDNVPMADGRTVQHFHVQFVETPDSGELRGGECDGMGIVDAAGVYGGHFLCTTSVSADDAFTTEWNDTAAGGDWVVTGGKGKFKGATGKGHTDYLWGDAVFGDRLLWSATSTMTLP